MMAEEMSNASRSLQGLERQSARAPLARVKILNKFRGLIGLCLLDNSESEPQSASLRQGIVRLCEDIGLRCSCLEPAGNIAYDRTAKDAERPGRQTADSLPSCQVSVEEKIQLFSFLRKG
jgi:hypothetical protein